MISNPVYEIMYNILRGYWFYCSSKLSSGKGNDCLRGRQAADVGSKMQESSEFVNSIPIDRINPLLYEFELTLYAHCINALHIDYSQLTTYINSISLNHVFATQQLSAN